MFSRRRRSVSPGAGFKVHSVVRVTDSLDGFSAAGPAAPLSPHSPSYVPENSSFQPSEYNRSRPGADVPPRADVPTIVMTSHQPDARDSSPDELEDSYQTAHSPSSALDYQTAAPDRSYRLSVDSQYSVTSQGSVGSASSVSDSRRNRFSAAFKDKLHLSRSGSADSRGEEATPSPSGGSLVAPYGRARSNSGHRHMRIRSSSSDKQRHLSASSSHLPEDLPALSAEDALEARLKAKEQQDSDAAVYETEMMWESRAVKLAMKESEVDRSVAGMQSLRLSQSSFSGSAASDLSSSTAGNGSLSGVSPTSHAATPFSESTETDLQTAIDLHESGQLEQSTRLFGQLANPEGANHPLAQVLYGLALRHGWGLAPDLNKAIYYFRLAASNSAFIEDAAKRANVKMHARNRKAGVGGAKGELTLAIFELGNCFRYGWGVEQDAVAAKQYYETAANLGDADAMTECAWCYLEGFGCEKDKFLAAQFYRMAEEAGKAEVGQSWIWKPKYDPTPENLSTRKNGSRRRHMFHKK
ncbi:hypothetical protein BZA70DRAFT_184354 [Myxozyma melibiosi]|uniref:HCP-like protein n=1 Tax=Myxozyma melibiosi TaxID=54550 RepID=A0ABR1F4P4_9ASCO